MSKRAWDSLPDELRESFLSARVKALAEATTRQRQIQALNGRKLASGTELAVDQLERIMNEKDLITNLAGKL